MQQLRLVRSCLSRGLRNGIAVAVVVTAGSVSCVSASAGIAAYHPPQAVGTELPRVSPPEIAALVVAPAEAEFIVGSTLQLLVWVAGIDGERIEAEVEWSSSNPAVASVDDAGLATALREGETLVTAAAGHYSASTKLRIVPR